MRTIELTCDPVLDAAVRAVWRELADGGVDSLAGNVHPAHRPHLTLASVGAVGDAAIERAGELLAEALPLPVRFSGLLSFSARSRRRVLAWGVVPSPELVALHAAVWRELGSADEPNPLYLPGRWMPHLGLSRRLDSIGLTRAHELLGRHPDLTGTFDAARTFDSETQLTRPLPTDPA